MRLGRDPAFACCIMFPTDRELARGIRDIDLGDFPEDSFQGFPLRAARVVRKRRDPRSIADDLASCGFNAALLVGFCGSNFTPEDVRSPRFVALTRALKKRRIAVGVCIPFADTVDNLLTGADPGMHQLRRDGKRPFVRFDPELEEPPYPIYIIDYGCGRFISHACAVIDAARDAGMDFIDFAEPDYWPTPGNGYGTYLEAAWKRKTGTPLPWPSTPSHRLFMEDYHLEAMRGISGYAHRRGLQDHLTASPLGHAPYHICQNYGKYALTSISELSSTYHFLYGQAWRDRLARRYGIDCPPHRMSSLGCMETRSMRRWDERHATYLVPGQSLPALTFANALDQQMFLHNMDIVFWEYPSIRRNYYESSDAWAGTEAAWRILRELFAERARAYRSLPAGFHAAIPSPEALVLFSKRGVYADESADAATPCAYVTCLRLIAGAIQPLFLYAEDLSPLASARSDARLLLVDEHHPVPPGGWAAVAVWLRRGGRAVIYGGSPGRDWESGRKLATHAADLRRLFGIDRSRGASGERSARRPVARSTCPVEFPLSDSTRTSTFHPGPGTTVIARHAGQPFASMKAVSATSRAIYVALPLCELPGISLAELGAWALSVTGPRSVFRDGPLDLEHCLYRGPGKRWLAVKNHSMESRTTLFSIHTGFRPSRVRELLGQRKIAVESFGHGAVTFRDAPGPNSIGIYELSR